jgi:plastocyanin
MTVIRCKTFGLLLACIVGLFVVIATPRPVAGASQTGGVSGRIIFATVPPEEFFAPTDAVVYLTGAGLADAPGVPRSAPQVSLLDQINYAFVPRVLAVDAGAELRFHNGDSELHNIHTFAKGPSVNRMFNRSQLPGSTFTETFEQPESILVRCDLHSQMIAHLLVLPNPFHTMPNEDGSYSLEGVPPGSYELTAWHELFGQVTVPIDVASGRIAPVDVTFSEPLE